MFSIDELKQIQLYRQHLTDKADKHTVCHDMNGIQAQFTVNVEHALKIRCSEQIEKDDFGSGLVKNWTIRNTVHVFNREDLPVFKYQDEGNPYLSHDWSLKNFFVDGIRHESGMNPERIDRIARFLVDKVSASITAREDLKQECNSAGFSETEVKAVFNQWGGLLRPLCERGFLCYKVQEKKEFMICPPYTPIEQDEALTEQARRYFTHFAPATIKDVSYYFGWTQTYAREVMKKLPLSTIQINGRDYHYLGTLQTNYPDIPHCLFLAGFDQLMLGYQKSESIYLPQEHLRSIFNLAGIVMPSILLKGRVVGKWKKQKTKLMITLFEDVTQKDKRSLIQTAESLWNDIKKIEWKP